MFSLLMGALSIEHMPSTQRLRWAENENVCSPNSFIFYYIDSDSDGYWMVNYVNSFISFEPKRYLVMIAQKPYSESFVPLEEIRLF